MSTDFKLFGPRHWLILTAVFGFSAMLSRIASRSPAAGKNVRVSLGLILSANELIWYVYRYRVEGFRFPEALPLQLCDLTIWLTVLSALTLKPLPYELAYYAGLGGTGMALITPDLWVPFWSYPSMYFFLSHGLVVVTLWVIAWSGMARPRPGSVWRTFLILNGFAAAVGVFDAVFKTNYMYLAQKPPNPSLLDYFGPWPVYIVVEEVVAIAVFWLLWLPMTVRHREQLQLPHTTHAPAWSESLVTSSLSLSNY